MSEDFVRPAIKTLKEYIPGKTPKEPGVIKLSSNENPFGASPKALEAIAKDSKNIQIYPDQKCVLLREALGKKLGVPEECIICGNGSDEIMQLAAATFLKPGEEVLVPENTFSVYEFTARLLDGIPFFIELKNLEQDLDGMLKSISNKTKMIFICNPHNPSGSYINQKDLEIFLAKVSENVLVVLDEAYAGFVEAKDFPKSLEYVKEGRNVIVLRTFSKLRGLAGLRIGYGVARKELTQFMYRSKLPFNVNRLAQTAATAALNDERFIEKTFKNNIEGKNYLYTELDKLGLEYKKTQSNFVYINLKRSADVVFMELMKEKIIIRPLTSFGFEDAIRVTIGTKDQNKRFIAALKKVLS